MNRYRLDTNVLVRFLVQDDEKQSPKATALFKQASDGACLLIVGTAVLVETVWVLSSVYDHPREKIAEALTKVLIKPGIRCEDAQTVLDALDRYHDTNLDIVDCLIAAESVAEGDSVATFDRDFRKFADVRVWDHQKTANKKE